MRHFARFLSLCSAAASYDMQVMANASLMKNEGWLTIDEENNLLNIYSKHYANELNHTFIYQMRQTK